MKTVLVAATAALLATCATGFAQTSHILGSDGPHVKLDVTCRRAVVAPPGQTVEMDVNVIGQQVHCLIRRPDPAEVCRKRLGATPTVKLVRKDDWVGVKQLRDYVAALGDCSGAHL